MGAVRDTRISRLRVITPPLESARLYNYRHGVVIYDQIKTYFFVDVAAYKNDKKKKCIKKTARPHAKTTSISSAARA